MQNFFNNNVLERTNTFKYLGIWLDSNLTWKNHIDSLNSKLNSYVSLFYKHRDLLPLKCRKTLYYAYVYPTLMYGIEVYGLTNKTTLNRLSVTCNRILRVLQFADKRTPSAQLYANFDALPLEMIYRFNILKFVYKCVNVPNRVPLHFTNLFTFNHNIHNYSTRNSHKIHMVNNCHKNSIIFNMSVMWNNLPDRLKSIPTEYLFYRDLKQYLTV